MTLHVKIRAVQVRMLQAKVIDAEITTKWKLSAACETNVMWTIRCTFQGNVAVQRLIFLTLMGRAEASVKGFDVYR
jgi:hypothetical protein